MSVFAIVRTWLVAAVFLAVPMAGVAGSGSPSPVFAQWRAGTVVSAREVTAYGVDRCFRASALSDKVFARMRYSYVDNPYVRRADLRYLQVLHYDLSGRILLGEMVCNHRIADDLLTIFRQLYEARYPIGRMVLIDEYHADDESSMRANNTSCFCYRRIAGSSHVSAHGRGMAVDINPLYNPYVKRRANGTLFIQPATAGAYIHRDRTFDYKLEKGDLCYRLFIQHGFQWGGAWRSCQDYQHFEKR